MPFDAQAIVRRLTRVRAETAAAGLDALVVTHLPNVQYLTGFAGTAGAVVVLRAACILAVDFRYVTAGREVMASLPAGVLALEPVERSYDDAIVAVLRRSGCRRIGVEAQHLAVSRFNAMSSGLVAGSPTPLRTPDPMPVLVPTERVVERGRMVKDEGEVAVLREAGRRLSRVARRLREFAVEGRTEVEVAWQIDQAMRQEGFSRPAFDTIVASGPNSALPHARPTGRRLGRGDAVVLDFGGVYDGYCVDLTRTVQLGAASGDVGRLFTAVAQAQAAALAAVRPGIRASEVDAAARDVLAGHGLAGAFGHGTGHGLGLEVHEEPRVARALPGQPDEVLVPGMVFTVEPGAYVPGLGGVRIEDDVLVTGEGGELLTDVPGSL
jgi:Xaa-Pro aminopeptidase